MSGGASRSYSGLSISASAERRSRIDAGLPKVSTRSQARIAALRLVRRSASSTPRPYKLPRRCPQRDFHVTFIGAAPIALLGRLGPGFGGSRGVALAAVKHLATRALPAVALVFAVSIPLA